MILEFDLGNSRFKWRLRNADDTPGPGTARTQAPQAPQGHPTRGIADADEQSIAAALAALPVRPLRVRGGSVAAERLDECLAAAVARLWGIPVEFAHSAAEAAGVHNGYLEPGRLGVDRWLAVVAAYRNTADAVLVIDAGSALTIDLVDPTGDHLGGYILPGRQMLLDRLQSATARVRFNPVVPAGGAPGRDTAAAVEGGARLACRGAVLAAMNEARARLGSYRLVMTGGDGPRLLAELELGAERDADLIPDLVLDGLRWVVP